MFQYCYDCNKETEFVPIAREEKLNVRGELITGALRYLRCSVCGLEYITELTTPGLVAVYDEYRRRKGLPGPEEIRSLREKCGMTREEFAAATGISMENLRRYETGAVIKESDASRLIVQRLAALLW